MYENRVVVAMSGGVDSSVAAAFLKAKGYEVIGLTMRFWEKENRCCSEEDLKDARHVARRLGIPHYVVSFQESFQKHVVDYFVAEYIRGRTPNPCAVCNPAIKFGELLFKARELNAPHFATGHYAIVSYNAEHKRYELRRGKDRGKDQSYFLARLSQNALAKALFPVGSFPKEKIRKLAERFGLPVASKKESQEICFIPDGDVVGFIQRQKQKPLPSGPIVDESGQVLGTHKGITGYTVGQRRGLGIAVGKPLYVTRIHAETNTIVVGGDEAIYKKSFLASEPHWISISSLTEPMEVQARIRYKHHPADALLSPVSEEKVQVTFHRHQKAITPGQLAVFYSGDTVVGSAWIDEVLN